MGIIAQKEQEIKALKIIYQEKLEEKAKLKREVEEPVQTDSGR